MVEATGVALRFDQANVLQRGMRLLAGTRPMAWLFARVLHHLDGPVMRRSAGRHSVSSALTGLPIVELTTVGARSGEPRSLPLIGVPDGNRLVLVASNYGQQRNPAWYYNLKANPRCSVAFAVNVTKWTRMKPRARNASGCGSWTWRCTRPATTTHSGPETVAFR